MTVLSGSMEPFIKTGSVAVIKPSKVYKIGDVITYQIKDKNPITCRIVEIEVVDGKPFYITKGDANNAPDQKRLREEEIWGKVLFDVPYLGYLFEEIKRPIGFFTCNLFVCFCNYFLMSSKKFTKN